MSSADDKTSSSVIPAELMDLTKLAEPFPPDDIEWRVSRAGMGNKGVTAASYATSPIALCSSD
jgi:hypothetical protein